MILAIADAGPFFHFFGGSFLFFGTVVFSVQMFVDSEDLSITYISEASSQGGADTGAMSSLKMLKLARLGRILGQNDPKWGRTCLEKKHHNLGSNIWVIGLASIWFKDVFIWGHFEMQS